MAITKVDWPHHQAQYRALGQSAAEYCAAAGLTLNDKQKANRRQVKQCEEFYVESELIIGIDHRGSLTLSGFDLAQLPSIVGAWSNALSQ